MANNKLLGVFYSEFDNILGPKIAYQTGRCPSSDVFDKISDYFITKPHLCGKIVTCFQCLEADIKVMGFPVRIEDVKYHRNALMFNVGFVFDQTCDTSPYKSVLRKLTLFLRALELEGEFLFNPTKACRIASILHEVMSSLNECGECVINVDEANTLYLQLTSRRTEPPVILEHEVPVPCEFLNALACKEWDLAMLTVAPHINGTSHVARIATDADMDVAVVKQCLQQFIYYGLVTMVDIFQFSNVYVATDKLFNLVRNPQLAAACGRYASKTVAGSSLRSVLTPMALLTFFACFGSGRTVGSVCIESMIDSNGVDEQALVTFGVVHGFIQRVHEYPVYMSSVSHRGVRGDAESGNVSTPQLTPMAAPPVAAALSHLSLERTLLALCDGAHCIDDICCRLNRSYEETLVLLQQHKAAILKK